MSTVTTTTTLEEDEEVAEKLYKSIPGSTFYARDGQMVQWDHKGEARVSSKLQQRELDKIANKQGSPVYTEGHNGPVKVASDTQPAADIRARAEATVAQLKANQAVGKPS